MTVKKGEVEWDKVKECPACQGTKKIGKKKCLYCKGKGYWENGNK